MKLILNKRWMQAGLLGSLCFASSVFASLYPQPSPGNDLVGKTQYVTTHHDSFNSIAKRTDTGINQITGANPNLDPSSELADAENVKLPTHFILPTNVKRTGIVINLPEMRMYYFPHANTSDVFIYPIGIGRIGKTIPIKNTYVTKKVMNPTWTPPQDIREFNLEQGIVLPKVMAAGPDNPLGPYAIYLGIPTFLIHSTIFPDSIGTRASFGCIRMYSGDVEQLYNAVNRGTPVTIIDEPSKIGWQGKHIYLESHKPLEETTALTANENGIIHTVVNTLPLDRTVLIDWQMISYIAQNPDGMPHEVGTAV